MIEKLVPVCLQLFIKFLKGNGCIQLIDKGQSIYKHACHLFFLEIQTVNGGDTDAEPLLPFDPAQIDRQSHIKHGKRGYLLFPAEACDHTVHPVGDCKRPADSHRADLGVGVFFCCCRLYILQHGLPVFPVTFKAF